MAQRWNVCAIVFWRVVWYRAGTFLCMRSCPCPSWPSWSRRGCGRAVARPSCPGRRDVPGHGRRDVAVASMNVAVARRGRGRGARSLFAAVRWLRHADGC